MLIQNLKYTKYYFSVLINNYFFLKSTYSQHGEDCLVEQIIMPDRISSFLDIGANDGVLFSNTYKFARSGAEGICVEPSISSFIKLKLNYLFNRRVKCYRFAISNNVGQTFFKEYGYENVLSKITTQELSNSYAVKTLTISKLIKDFSKFNSFDLVSIDVEGAEDKVLDGAENSLFQSKIVILEIDKLSTDNLTNHPALSNHYPAYSNGVNLILLNHNFSFGKPKFLPNGFHTC